MTKAINRRNALALLAAPALLGHGGGLSARAQAQQPYPNRPVKVMVPFPPGGSFDGVPRVVLQDIAEERGWTYVIENRPGADGQVGLGAAKRNPPDGYNLAAITSITHGSAPALKLNPGYDPVTDFIPIVLLADAAMVLLVKKDLPVRSLAEFIALLKERPGKLNYGSGGTSSQHFFATAMLLQRAGLPLDIAAHVPYPGIAPALLSLLAGTVDFMFGSTGPATQNIETGAIRALVTSSAKRSPRLPDVPTMAESGYPGFEIVSWVGLAAPAETPAPIIEQWNRHANAALRKPAVREKIAGLDYEIRGGTPAEFAAFSVADMAQYRKLVDDLQLPRR